MMANRSSVKEEVLARVQTFRILPSLRAIINELLAVMAREDASPQDLFRIIKYDQAITSKILSVANSAYYSRGSTISDLERAMVAIGFDEIKKIVMCLIFLEEILDVPRLNSHDVARLWSHSLSVACTGKALHHHLSSGQDGLVFTAAMLHDIGKVVLYTFADAYYAVENEAVQRGIDVCSLEEERFGLDHQAVGVAMSENWGFPEQIVSVIRDHHSKNGHPGSLLHMVSAADAFIMNPEGVADPEGAILRDEKERIMGEARKITEYLKVDPQA